MIEATRVDLEVNGTPRSVDAPPRWRLLELLREGLGLTGTKQGCDDGTCGTCVVMVDGKAVRACRTPASAAAGRRVLTIEGLGCTESPHALQQAFAAADAVQCGFCTPGMIMTAAALLERNPTPTRSEIARALGSNLCRCTGYQGIVDAIDGWRTGSRARFGGGHRRRRMAGIGSPRTQPGTCAQTRSTRRRAAPSTRRTSPLKGCSMLGRSGVPTRMPRSCASTRRARAGCRAWRRS